MLFFGVKTSSLLIINLHLPGHTALYFTSYCLVLTWWSEKKEKKKIHTITAHDVFIHEAERMDH